MEQMTDPLTAPISTASDWVTYFRGYRDGLKAAKDPDAGEMPVFDMRHSVRCGLMQLARISFLVEKYGSLLITNCAAVDDPGSMWTEQNRQIEQAHEFVSNRSVTSAKDTVR